MPPCSRAWRRFSINEPSNAIYVANTGVDGIEVVNTTTNTESLWAFDGTAKSAIGVVSLQGVPFVYSIQAGPSGSATIRQFDLSGNAVADYPVDNYSGLGTSINPDTDTLRMNPNGHVYFSTDTDSGPGGEIGIIGVSSVDVAAPVASFTVTNTGGRAFSFNGTASTARQSRKSPPGPGTSATEPPPLGPPPSTPMPPTAPIPSR